MFPSTPKAVPPQSDQRPGICSTAGLVAWHHSSLAVHALDPAVQFFEQAFGFRVTFVERGMSDQVARISGVAGLACDLAQLRHPCSGQVLELIAFAPPDGDAGQLRFPFAPGAAHIALVVEDLAAAIAAVQALGAVVLGAVVAFAEEVAVYCRVPGGAFLELEQRTRA